MGQSHVLFSKNPKNKKSSFFETPKPRILGFDKLNPSDFLGLSSSKPHAQPKEFFWLGEKNSTEEETAK